MKCELCGDGKTSLIVMLPIPQSDGKYDTVACEKCARASKAYCAEHDRVHQGFMDGTTACLACVQHLVEENKPIAGQTEIRLLGLLNKNEFDRVMERAEISSSITHERPEIAILRFIACKAIRTSKTIEDILAETTAKQSATVIIG